MDVIAFIDVKKIMLLFPKKRSDDVISYEPFWKTINERKITTYQLIYKQGILPDTIQRLRSGKTITTQTINTLCSVINCEVSDIMKYVPDTDDKN